MISYQVECLMINRCGREWILSHLFTAAQYTKIVAAYEKIASWGFLI